MLQKFFKTKTQEPGQVSVKKTYKWLSLLELPAWVLVCFFVAELIVTGLDSILRYFSIVQSLNSTLYNSFVTATVYIIVILLVIVVPKYVPKLNRYRISRESLGLTRYPAWRDILLVPAGIITYFILSSLLILLVSQAFPEFNINQTQRTGFEHLGSNYEYILAFVTLLIVVPFAEELLFRGYLFGKLRRSLPIWLAVIIVGILFSGLHGAWNVAIDVFALNIILCFLRESTDSIWAPVLLHMTKNGIAFYFLFINPVLLNTLGS